MERYTDPTWTLIDSGPKTCFDITRLNGVQNSGKIIESHLFMRVKLKSDGA